jgi:hypothetical protein
METLRTETRAGVRHVVLTRAAAYNTITPVLRDELAAAIDEADEDPAVHVILLRAEALRSAPATSSSSPPGTRLPSRSDGRAGIPSPTTA